jgi:DNA polymerase III gamma/tau subunit
VNKKRKCIFTGEEADCSVSIGQDKHNWAKKVPCTKKWYEMFLGKPLNSTQIKLVELFYEQEVARIKVDNIEAQMAEIRANAACPVVKEHKKRVENPFFYVDEPEDFTLENAREVEKISLKSKEEIVVCSTPKDGQYDIGDSEDLSWMESEERVNKDNFEELLLKSVEQAVEITKKDFNETMDEMDKIEEDSKDFWE